MEFSECEGVGIKYWLCTRFYDGSDGKESACNAGDPGLISELEKSPEEGNGSLLQHSCLRESHGQRSLAG